MPDVFFMAIFLKLTIVLGSAFLAHTILRRASAATRHAVWVAAMSGLIVLPLLQMLMPSVDVNPPLPLQNMPAVLTAAPVLAAPVTETPRGIRWPLILAWLWFAGGAVVLARTVNGLWRVRCMMRNATPTSNASFESLRRRLGVSPRVKLFVSENAKTPMTLGIRNPVVILPANSVEWPSERMEVVLSHELGHVRRGDWGSQMMARVACALYWFHPLVWWAERVMHREREHACDDLVLRMGVQPSAYAEHLLDIVRATTVPAWPATLPMASRSDLEVRLRALLASGKRRGTLSRRSAALAGIAAVAILLPLASLRAPAQVNTAKLTGTVMDASGAVIPNANVLLVSKTSRNKEVTRSNAAGDYMFNGVPAGEYTLEIRKGGFELSKTNVVVEPSRITRQDVKLNLGSVNESMEITATRPVAAAKAAEGNGTPKRIRVGGMVQATKIVKMVRPVYPDGAKVAGIEGDVVLEAVIGKEGKLLNLRSISTTAPPELVTAATDAVSKWEYQPTLLNGEPVEIVTTIHIGFHLK